MPRPQSNLPLPLPGHPRFTRRFALQAGAVGLLGLGMNHLDALRASKVLAAGDSSLTSKAPRAKSVIFIFLSGGLAQQDSFDLKPEAPEDIRGEFWPIDTATPGIQICEHLPMLAQRSQLWSLVRSLSHGSNGHSASHHIMLTGRSDLPTRFNSSRPGPEDWPSIAAVAGTVVPQKTNLPPAIVLPERLIHNSGRVIPGQFAGIMGPRRDPWFVEASPFEPKGYGAFPEFEFDHQERPRTPKRHRFEAPDLTLPEGIGSARMLSRTELLNQIDGQRGALEAFASNEPFDDQRQAAISLLTDPEVRRAFDVLDSDPKSLESYGNHSFGWSLLMARRLVESGVSLVQVNLGNNETWDTHGNAFPHLKNNLFPPTDQALSALLDDLQASGLLDSTLIVMAGEFGRTPRISHLPKHYELPGRDHWGRVQTVFFAGGGTIGGQVIGASDKIGGFPAQQPETPESFGATIYQALGIPKLATWQDDLERPHHVYRGDPIRGLLS